MPTNTKEVSQKVQEHILHSFDSYDEMMAELKNSQKHFAEEKRYDVGAQMADSAFFLIYHDDIRKFVEGITGEPAAVQADKYSPEQTWIFYKNLINKEVPKIMEEGSRSYIKPGNVERSSKKQMDAIIKTNHRNEDVWIKINDTEFSLLNPEKLEHTFGDTTVNFTTYEGNVRTTIRFGTEPDGNRLDVDIDGNADTAKRLVENTIKHFAGEKELDILDISKYLNSQSIDLHQETAVKNPLEITIQQAKTTGYVQGVCECVAAIGDNHTLGKKLLTEMNVTKDMAKKYANPETYKALEQGIFAPQQKLEQTHSFKR